MLEESHIKLLQNNSNSTLCNLNTTEAEKLTQELLIVIVHYVI